MSLLCGIRCVITVSIGLFYCIFFFKQKTAYEMRISDWSSDVCSSDLLNAIYEFAFERRTGLRRAFAPWVVDGKGVKGIRSHLMNAPRDTLGSVLSASHLVGINMNEALDDPDTGPPVVTHISSAVGQSGAESSNGFAI